MKTNRFFEMILGRMDGNPSLQYFNKQGKNCSEENAKWYCVRGSIHDAKTDKEIYTANLKTL